MMVLMTCSHWSRMVDVDVDAVVKQDVNDRMRMTHGDDTDDCERDYTRP